MNTLFYIVRHGESEGNVNGDILGGNSPLTLRGRQQALEAAERLRDVAFDLAFSSDLQRTIETANIILQNRNLAVTHLPRLREKHFGELENLPSKEALKDFQSELAAFPTLSPEEQWANKWVDSMESAREAVDRLVGFLEETSQTHAGKTILVVNHGALMRTLLVHLGVGSFLEYPAGSVTNTGHIKLRSTLDGFEVLEMVGVNKKE